MTYKKSVEYGQTTGNRQMWSERTAHGQTTEKSRQTMDRQLIGWAGHRHLKWTDHGQTIDKCGQTRQPWTEDRQSWTDNKQS